MTTKQNIREKVADKLQRGEISAAEANVLMIQMEGVRIVRGKMMADVRKALNEAVKNGTLGHIKKDGLKPEVYHHINARAKALDIREAEFRNSLQMISKVYSL